MRRILGIDPGLRLTGYALVQLPAGAFEPQLQDAGVLRLDAKLPVEDRLLQLHREMAELVADLAPTHMAIEKLYAHYKHPRTSILMAHARGVILLAAKQAELTIENLPSTEVKKAITGYGHATKEQMQHAVQSQCNLPELPKPPDVADAIAIALTHARRLAFAEL